jgi:hypothetical protein
MDVMTVRCGSERGHNTAPIGSLRRLPPAYILIVHLIWPQSPSRSSLVVDTDVPPADPPGVVSERPGVTRRT